MTHIMIVYLVLFSYVKSVLFIHTTFWKYINNKYKHFEPNQVLVRNTLIIIYNIEVQLIYLITGIYHVYDGI